MKINGKLIKEGFGNIFDSSLVDYSSDFEQTDKDYLYKPAKQLAEKDGTSFTYLLYGQLTNKVNINTMSQIILNPGYDIGAKTKYVVYLCVCSLNRAVNRKPAIGDHMGIIAFNVEITRETRVRPYAGQLMIEFYINGEKVYEYPKIIKFSVSSSLGRLLMDKAEKIFNIIQNDIKPIYLNSGLYNYYIDELQAAHGNAVKLEMKDGDRMYKCKRDRNYVASKLIKDKRKAIARYVAGGIIEHPNENMRTSYNFYTDGKDKGNDFQLETFLRTAKELGASLGDILSTYDAEAKNNPG